MPVTRSVWPGRALPRSGRTLPLPKETLQVLAGAPPVPPGGGVTVLSLPCCGALALFGAAVLVARHGAPDRTGARRA